jgi:curved DNA-binding protein CbpA
VSTETYYDLLGVTPDADTDQIRAAFRQLSMKIHPDSGGTDALFRTVKEAYDTLSDPVRRQQYDDLLSSPAGMYGNDEQEYNAPGWVRVDDTPSGNETSEPGHNGNHADSPPPHGDTWYTPPPSGQPPGHNGFAYDYTPSGYPRYQRSIRTKVIVISLALVYVMLLSNSQPVLFALLIFFLLPIVGLIVIFRKWRRKWIGR